MPGRKSTNHIDLNNQVKVVNSPASTANGEVVNHEQLAANATADRSRANHTGTQTASTVSDFDTQVRTSRLDQMAAPTGPVNLNNQRGTNVGAAITDTDVPSWGQVKDLISGQRKTDVRLVTTANDTLNGLAARDGVTPAAGDRVLVTGQTTASANGIYVAASGAWSRATDADVAGEFATEWLVTVQEGTVNQSTLWQHTTPAAGVTVTLGTTSITFTKVGPIASSGAAGATATSPATAAGGSWAWAHGLGSRGVLVQVYRSGSPYDDLDVYFERTDVNTVTFRPDVAMAAGEYTAVAFKAA